MELTATELKNQLVGNVFIPEEKEYEAARFAWNVAIDQRPDIVVVPENADDVVAAVRFASDKGLPIGVMTTGHGQPKTMAGGMLINMSHMRGVLVDADKRTARIEGGCVWADVVPKAYEVGLAPLTGSSPGVGVVGYTLGGGIPIMVRTYGLAIDAVRSAVLVTPKGELMRVSRTDNPEVFRCVMGGGGAFGVITEIEMELYASAEIYGGQLLFPAERAEEVYSFFAEWAPTQPESMSTSVIAMNFPPVPFVPEFLRGRSFVIVVACSTEPESAANHLQAVRDLGPEFDFAGPLPYTESAKVFNDPVDPLPAFGSGVLLKDFTLEAVPEFLSAVGELTRSPNLMIQLRHIEGAPSKGTNGCFGNRREARFLLYMLGVPMGPVTPQSMEEQRERVFNALAPWILCRGPLNWLGEGNVPAEHISDFYEEGEMAQLRSVKRDLDPSNSFAFASIGIVEAA